MAKKYMVQVDYSYYVFSSKEAAISFMEAIPVDREYINNEYIYMPKNKDFTFSFIDEDRIRLMTEKEKENKELKQAKQQADWAKEEAKKAKAEVEDLKCQLKQLLKKDAP